MDVPHASSVSRSSVSPPSASKPSSFITYRSFTLTSAVISLRCSVPRWGHGVDWRSPVSLRAQIRTVLPSSNALSEGLQLWLLSIPFREILTSLPQPGGGDLGKFYSHPALNDPRIG